MFNSRCSIRPDLELSFRTPFLDKVTRSTKRHAGKVPLHLFRNFVKAKPELKTYFSNEEGLRITSSVCLVSSRCFFNALPIIIPTNSHINWFAWVLQHLSAVLAPVKQALNVKLRSEFSTFKTKRNFFLHLIPTNSFITGFTKNRCSIGSKSIAVISVRKSSAT